VKLTTHLRLAPRSKNTWSYTSLPQYAFMAWCSVKKHKDSFTFHPEPKDAQNFKNRNITNVDECLQLLQNYFSSRPPWWLSAAIFSLCSYSYTRSHTLEHECTISWSTYRLDVLLELSVVVPWNSPDICIDQAVQWT